MVPSTVLLAPQGQAAVWEPWKYPVSPVFQNSGKSTCLLRSPLRWSSSSLHRSSSSAVLSRCAPDSSSSLTSRTLIPTAHAASSLSFGRGSVNSATCSGVFTSKSQWDSKSGRYLGKKNVFLSNWTIIFFFMNMLLLQIVTRLITCFSDTAMDKLGKEEWSLRRLTDDIQPYSPAEHVQRSSTPVHSSKILSCAALLGRLFEVFPSWTRFAAFSFLLSMLI